MIKGNNLIKGFKKQDRNTIWKYLESLGEDAKIFSDCQVGIMPHLGNNVFYIYAVHTSLVVVCLDNCPPKDELADEETFNDEQPLYFTENSRRVSPVWQLSETIKLIKAKMEEGHNCWPILGVLLTESTIINADDMRDVWDEMNVEVIDRVEYEPHHNIPMNPAPGLAFGKMIMGFIKELNELQPSTKDEDDEFIALLDKFCNNGIKPENDDEEEADDEGEEGETDDSCLNLPSGIIEQNNNVSVRVKILPPMKNPRAELDKLVGCQDIKNHIDELLTLTRYNEMLLRAFPDAMIHEVSLHSIFFGRPGTGKTTVCKIFGSLLHEAGVLSKGHVVVAERGTFLGTLWGDEERSVTQVLEIAKGGVLMIDEAYLLNSPNERDPGRMVIQLLMQMLADETERNIAVVLCGYKEPMLKLIESNPGLHSRFPNRFEFRDFTLDELMEITRRRMGEYRYHFTQQAWQKYKSVLTAAYQVRDSQTWGNARFVANQLERIFIQHAQRCVKENPDNGQRLLTITQADVIPIEVPRSKPRIGF